MRSPFAIFSVLLEDPEQPVTPGMPEGNEPDDSDEVMAHVRSAMTRINDPVPIQGDTERDYWIKKLSLAQQGRGNRKKLENNTYVELTGYGERGAEEVGIRLHRTYVIRIRSDNSCTVNTGGWSTRTTQDRINSHLPGSWFVYTVKGDWYWGNRSTHVGYAEDSGERIPFESGDTIDGQGVLHPQNAPEYLKIRKKREPARRAFDSGPDE